MSCGGRNFRFRVVVTKSVETLRPLREGRRPPEGGAHLGHVFRGQSQKPLQFDPPPEAKVESRRRTLECQSLKKKTVRWSFVTDLVSVI